MLDTRNGITDRLKRFAVTFVIVVLVQLLLAGPTATAAWWQATAELASNAMARLASVVDTIGDGVDGTALDADT